MRVLFFEQRDAQRQRHVDAHALRGAHRFEERLNLPFDFPALIRRTRAARDEERGVASTWLSNHFCDGCGESGQSPSSEPRCRASSSRSSTCASVVVNALSNRLFPDPVRPQITM
jgi:hypothetical protein